MQTTVQPPDVTRTSESGAASPRGRLWTILGQYATQLLLLLLVIILGIINPNFRQWANVQSILTQASFTGIGAIGMTLIIIAGAFDLSVAGIVAICATTVANTISVIGVAGSVAVAVLVGIALGLLNGAIVTKVRIPAFITTLGMMYIYQAVVLIWTNGVTLSISDTNFQNLGTGTLAGVPIPFLVMIGAYLLGFVILRFTTYGRYLRAVGSNDTAARIVGIPVDRVLIFAFALVGLFTAIGGVLLTAQQSSADATLATGYELNAIAIVVVGGTSLAGGQGTLLGTFTGALIFAVIYNALNLFNVPSYWQYVAIGLVLILALGLESLRRHLVGARTRARTAA